MTERIRQASDISDVVSAHVTLRRAGRTLKGLCPFHQEKTPSFHVSPERQTFKCFGCGAGGDVFKFIQLLERVDFVEARNILATRAGIPIDPQPRLSEQGRPGPSKVDIDRVNRWGARWFAAQLRSPAGRTAMEYALSRGLTPETIERFGLGLAPPGWDSLCLAAAARNIPREVLLSAGLIKPRDDGSVYDAFRNRLIFPIIDSMDRVVGFGGRALDDDPAKYVNSPQSALFDKGRSLYGLNLARDAFRERRTAVVVEGYIDCILAHQYGLPHTVATLGTALTAEHVRLLRRWVDEVVLVFDADEAGRRAADQCLPLFLHGALDVRLAWVPEGKDPADFLALRGREAFERVLTSATPGLEFKWDSVLRQFGSDAAGPNRRRAVEEYLGLIAGCAEFGTIDPIQRGLVLNQVGKILGLPVEEIHRRLRDLARRSAPARKTDSAARPSAPADSAEAAMRDLIAVLLNDPGYYQAVSAEFDPQLIEDGELREIAEGIVGLATRNAAFTPAELMGRFEAVEIARRITDLQLVGEAQQNYQATVDGALARLRRAREDRELARVHAELRGVALVPDARTADDPPAPGAGDEAAVMRRYVEARARYRHFAARKHLAGLAEVRGSARPPPGGG